MKYIYAIKKSVITTFFLVGVFGFFVSSLTLANTQPASALSGSDFRADRIIDDSVFYNKSAMSIPQIQSFLNAKVPTCDTWGTQSYGGTTRAAYAAARGVSTPFTCLKDYQQTIPTVINGGSDLCTGSIAGGTKTAANIIYDVAHACGINPQVLLITLQKEQSLVTDDWPWPIQYTKATGYGCPDSALGSDVDANQNGCYDAYEGFFNQVYNSAKGFKRYQANPQNYNYQAGRNNTILWHPNTACGSSNVFIQNQATAGLYIYTPYRPNQAALNNLYGLGDSCSSYGNRNFWRVFNDWFGPTLGSPFISNGGKVYLLGAEDTYYYVPSQELLNNYGFGSAYNGITPVPKSFLDDRTNGGNLPWIARFQDNAIYLVENGRRHHFATPEVFAGYGYSFGDEAVLPAYMKNSLSSSDRMRYVMKINGMPNVYFMEDGKRRHIGNEKAYNTMGDPIYSSRSSVYVPENYMRTLVKGSPILPSGTEIYSYDTGQRHLYVNGIRYPTDLSSFRSWDISGATYYGHSSAINQITSGPSLGVFAKLDNNNLYVLDHRRKMKVENSDLTNLGLTASDFVTVPADVLNIFSVDTTFSTLLQRRGYARVDSVINGERYHVYQEDDFTGSGYSWNDIRTAELETIRRFESNENKLYRTGKLLRPNNSPKVYVVDGSFKKRHIPNEGVFNQYGFSFNQVRVVPPSYLNGYDSDDQLSQVIKDSSDNMWLIDRGKRYTISSDTTINTYGYSVASTQQLDDALIAKYSVSGELNDLIRASNSLRVYKIEDGQKRWITSQQALFDNGHSLNDVKVYSSTFVSSLPNGSDIN